MDKPKAISPFNFFKVGGITSGLQISMHGVISLPDATFFDK